MAVVSSGGQGEAARAAQPPFDLARLIHPVDPETFAAEYWEKQPLVIHREDPDYYADLLTLGDVDRILSSARPRAEDLRVLENGTDIPVSDLVSAEAGGLANGLEALYDRYRQGATINLLFLQDRWAPLRTLCQSLAAELSAGFQTNVYLTPAGNAQGLKPHFDTHDVFVTQVYGSKHWNLYESTLPLPLLSQHYSPPKGGPGAPVREFDLHPGDLLYLPRGYVHAATSEQTASLHVTIGVFPVLWAHLVRDVVEQAILADHRFRQALPLGFATSEQRQELARVRAGELLDLLRDSVTPAEMVGAATRRAWLERQPELGGHLLDLEEVRSLTLETPVRRRPRLMSKLSVDGDQVRLEFHGKSVRLPGYLLDELRFVTETDEFTGKDIPGGLDEDGRLVLLTMLVKEGYLTLA